MSAFKSDAEMDVRTFQVKYCQQAAIIASASSESGQRTVEDAFKALEKLQSDFIKNHKNDPDTLSLALENEKMYEARNSIKDSNYTGGGKSDPRTPEERINECHAKLAEAADNTLPLTPKYR